VARCRDCLPDRSLEVRAERTLTVRVPRRTSRGSTADNTYYVNRTKGNLSRFLVENNALSARRAIEGAELAGEGAGDTSSIRIVSDGIQRESSENADLGGVEAGSQSSFGSIDWNIESISKSVKASQISDDGISLTPDRECGSSPMQKIDVKSDVVECATSTSLSCASNFDNSKSILSRHDAELENLIGKSQPAQQEFDQQHVAAPTDFYESLDQALRWVIDEQINVHYFPAIMADAAGTERSLWPEFWSLDYLNSIRHTRNFYMNYLNKPTSLDSYRYTMISVDPAIKTKAANDYTGIVVVSFGDDGKCYVRHAEQIRIVSTELKQKITDLIEKFDAKLVYCEVNQGGDLWRSVFDGIPAKFRSVHQTEKKELRAARALDYYKKNLVFHTKNFSDLEEQMFAFPKVPHDDILDAMATGVHYFLGNSQKSTARKRSYL
jgi:predicted phage terminase large subunit-like protein